MSDIINLVEVEKKIKELYEHAEKNIALMFDERASIDVFSALSYNGIKLKGICSMHVEQNKIVILQPYDSSNLKGLEDMLQKSNLGYLITVRDKKIYAEKEKLFDSVKQDIIKGAKLAQENTLVAVRKIRQDVLHEIKDKKKTISENIANKLEKDLQKIVDDFSKKIKDIPTHF